MFVRFRFGKIVRRVKHAVFDFSPRSLFDRTHDPAVFVVETSENRVVGVAMVSHFMGGVSQVHWLQT
jgi:hypothetical protein